MIPADQRCPVCHGSGISSPTLHPIWHSVSPPESSPCSICGATGLLSDSDLVKANRHTRGDANDPVILALLAETHRRGLGA
jgi:hypothetical protein